MFVFKHQHILDTKPCTEKYIHIFSFENIPVVPTVRALVCLWTDSQQWTGFFSNLLIRVSNSATTLSERNKIIQKNQQNQPTKNQQQQQKKTTSHSRVWDFQNWRAPGNSDKSIRECWTATRSKPVAVLKTFSQDQKVREVLLKLWYHGRPDLIK